MNRWLWAAFMVVMVVPADAAAPSVKALAPVMSKVYGHYSLHRQCWFDGQMCMKPAASKSIHVGGKSYTFLTMSGNPVDFEDRNLDGHADSGQLGFFVFAGKPSRRTLKAHLDMQSGCWGSPGQAVFTQFGPGTFGWRIQDGFMQHGCLSALESFVAFDGKKLSQIGTIRTVQEDESGFAPSFNYTAKLHFLRSQADKGLYPLQITVSRTVKGKKLSPVTFVLHPKKGVYREPKNYPIKGF